jgi:copper chaperone
METLKFKTNVKCGGCVSAITPFLDQDQLISAWKVDLENPDRVLTVETAHPAGEIQELLKKAGYTATEIA